jgi:membrane protein YqaA with SNARE-associated domain
MENENPAHVPESPPPEQAGVSNSRGPNRRGRNLLFILESVFVLVLLIVWVSSGLIQKSTNLFVLFFYSFPSEFLIAVLPHEPVIIYFGKYFNPLAVTAVALTSTLLVELSNYFVIRYLFDLRMFQRVKASTLVNKVLRLFQKAPFLAILLAGFIPIPFYPMRFLVVLARYPLWKYLLAVSLSRGPRFYLLALAGKLFKIPNYVLIIFTIFLIITANFAFVRDFWRRKIRKRHLLKRAEKENEPGAVV